MVWELEPLLGPVVLLWSRPKSVTLGTEADFKEATRHTGKALSPCPDYTIDASLGTNGNLTTISSAYQTMMRGRTTQPGS